MNRVLDKDFAVSHNFFESDLILKHFIDKYISNAGRAFMLSKLQRLGQQAAGEMNPLSLIADKQGPVLVKRDFYGETINKVEFHPAYEELTKIAVESGMFSVKWEPNNRQRFQQERHRLGFLAGYLYAMSESGLYCPLCMTDGVARLIDRYCDEEDKARLLPHIYTENPEHLYTGAMFLTEKAGGSDVGANLVTAQQYWEKYYLLNGEKWFCSNVNAEIIFALARPHGAVEGTRGLGIFLVEQQKRDGSKNEMDVIRLKDKLGVRSMASAECIMTDTEGKLVGEKGQGFKIMTDMINLSRLYNSVAAISGMRRALIEAYQFLKYRTTFGANVLDHALVRTKLLELGALNVANFYITWRAIETLDKADNGDTQAKDLIRFLTPMVKKITAQDTVYSVRESMELMGGLGYIEDGVMPKIMRDVMVLPIWEGAGNIMLLDMLRAMVKSKGSQVMIQEIQASMDQLSDVDAAFLKEDLYQVQKLAISLLTQNKDTIEATIKPLFERLTRYYQITSMLYYRDEESKAWINPAIDYLISQLKPQKLALVRPPSREAIDQLLAWEI
ncbi:MAG: acyl-CoA dehydrogenase [Aureispira sp.]|nr:acyl-CoA dehydrogenase [Aureispira sp.]